MQRFWDKVEKTETCWNWVAGIRNGYGCIKYKRKTIDAHRFSWFLHTGKMPELWILHSCDNRRCVNPEHLREGTPLENWYDLMVRGNPGIRIGQEKNRAKTHCPQGHPYDATNTIIQKDGKGLRRQCRICKRKQVKNSRIRKALLVKRQTRQT